MKPLHSTLIYFSPTGTTKQVLETISRGINLTVSTTIDIVQERKNSLPKTFSKNELVVIGSPVYAGRLPVDVEEYVNKLKGDGTPVVIVVLYGNREYDDALLELKDGMESNGFSPVACGAFIGEHSFSCQEFPIAVSRPDDSDTRKAESFGRDIARKLSDDASTGDYPELTVPGNRPYKERHTIGAIDFIGVSEACVDCGECARVCPNGVISESDSRSMDLDNCIHCCACVKFCPEEARFVKESKILDIAKRLNEFCQERKEPELFL